MQSENSFENYINSCSQDDLNDLATATTKLIEKGDTKESIVAKVEEAGWPHDFTEWYVSESLTAGQAKVLTANPAPPPVAPTASIFSQAPTYPRLPGEYVPDDQCVNCGTRSYDIPKKHGSLGLQKFTCANCGTENILPLKTSTRIIYWVLISLFGAISVVAFATGRFAIPGVLVVLSAVALAMDHSARKNRKS